jgi:hypothetical protein
VGIGIFVAGESCGLKHELNLDSIERKDNSIALGPVAVDRLVITSEAVQPAPTCGAASAVRARSLAAREQVERRFLKATRRIFPRAQGSHLDLVTRPLQVGRVDRPGLRHQQAGHLAQHRLELVGRNLSSARNDRA